METVIQIEVTKKEVKSIEKMLDRTLDVLRRLEEDSPQREVRILQTQTETRKIKKEIQKQMSVLRERLNRPDKTV